jgi:hypothetical protein
MLAASLAFFSCISADSGSSCSTTGSCRMVLMNFV